MYLYILSTYRSTDTTAAELRLLDVLEHWSDEFLSIDCGCLFLEILPRYLF